VKHFAAIGILLGLVFLGWFVRRVANIIGKVLELHEDLQERM
jgi:hypothetical protein